MNNVDYLYKDQQMPFFLKALITIFTIVVFSSLAYLLTEKYYDYPDFDRKILQLKTLLSLRKKEIKGKDFDAKVYQETKEQCKIDLKDEHKDTHLLLNVFVEFESRANDTQVD